MGERVEGNPGYCGSKFFLRPHYQLEGLTVSLRLVSKLPSAKGGGFDVAGRRRTPATLGLGAQRPWIKREGHLLMAVDMFLDLGKEIKGESQDSKHKGTIDILAWSWGMSQAGTFHGGGGGGAGKANFQDLSLTKYVDSASATLLLYCANGDHFEPRILRRKGAGKNPSSTSRSTWSRCS